MLASTKLVQRSATILTRKQTSRVFGQALRCYGSYTSSSSHRPYSYAAVQQQHFRHQEPQNNSVPDVARSPFSVPIRFTQLFINNEFVNAQRGKSFDVIDPSTGDLITRVQEADAQDVDIAVKAARYAFEKVWKYKSPQERATIIFRLADLMEENIDELAALESIDNGKTFTVARNVDIQGCINTFRYFAGWATKIHGKTIVPEGDYQVQTRHEPMGVVGAIIPWNFPLLMATWKLAPCLSSGNTVVIKSSEKTPLSLLRFADLTRQAGFPPGVINVLSGFGPTAGEPIARHMDVDKVAFTGSTVVGRKIMIAAAESNLKKVTVELGGKSPAIVFPDVDLDEAVEGTHGGLFFNHGQTCCAGSRVFVHESIYEEFVKRSVARVKKLPLSSKVDAGSALGPTVDLSQQKRVLGYIESGVREGAKIAIGGHSGDRGAYVEPTIFTDVEDHMKIAKEEIFGPVMSILKFRTIDEIIQRANDSPYGLAASVWTHDINKAYYVANHLKAGSVWINCHNVLQPSIPFGGFKQSGFGRDLGEYALNEYTQVKAVVTKLPSNQDTIKIDIRRGY